jgi:hypothetical protein
MAQEPSSRRVAESFPLAIALLIVPLLTPQCRAAWPRVNMLRVSGQREVNGPGPRMATPHEAHLDATLPQQGCHASQMGRHRPGVARQCERAIRSSERMEQLCGGALPRKLRGQHRAHCRYHRGCVWRHVIRPRKKPQTAETHSSITFFSQTNHAYHRVVGLRKLGLLFVWILN